MIGRLRSTSFPMCSTSHLWSMSLLHCLIMMMTIITSARSENVKEDTCNCSNGTTISTASPSPEPAVNCTVPSDCGLGAVCLTTTTAGHCACPVGRHWSQTAGEGHGSLNWSSFHCLPVHCTRDSDCWTWPNAVCEDGEQSNGSSCICAGPQYEYGSQHTTCRLTVASIVFIVFASIAVCISLTCLLCSLAVFCCGLLAQPAIFSHGPELTPDTQADPRGKMRGGDEELKTDVTIRRVASRSSGGSCNFKASKKWSSNGSKKMINKSNTIRPSSPDNLSMLSEKNTVFFMSV